MSTARSDRDGHRARTSMPRAAAIAGAAILGGASAIHAYWAAGGRWGATTAVGSTDLPPQALTAIVTVMIAAAAVLLLARVGMLTTPLPDRLVRAATWALVAVFAVAAVNNIIQPSDAYARDWHVYFFGPLLMIVAALSAIVASSKHPH
ncbi:MAG: DUF3995 domain-containing protein [Chloroflexota bacterium]|nr:DUF3995 domain-containing protein [Chloroflexota bacterium]